MNGPRLRNEDSRYLGYHSIPWGPPSPWENFLKSCQCSAPLQLGLDYLCSRGWLAPSAKLVLDPASFLDWKNFPLMPMSGAFSSPSSLGSSRIWDVLIQGLHVLPHGLGELKAPLHPMDDPDWVKMQLNEGSGGQGHHTSSEPSQVVHPRRASSPFSPIVWAFPYWQAYRLSSLWNEAQLPIALRPELEELVKGEIQKLLSESGRALLLAREARVLGRWQELGVLFDVISEYRTAHGIAARAWQSSVTVRNAFMTSAAKQILQRAELDADSWKMLVRDRLLVLASEWKLDEFPFSRHDHLRRLLQEDVLFAAEVISRIEGEFPDFFDEFWGEPADRMRKPWLPLGRALPMEDYAALRDFTGQASIYFKALPMELSKALYDQLEDRWKEVRALAKISWPTVRFVVNFQRLHAHVDGSVNRDNLVDLKLETPLESAQNISLQLESLLRPLSSASAKSFRKMLRELLIWAFKARKLPKLSASLGEFDKKTEELYKAMNEVPKELGVVEPAMFKELGAGGAFLLAGFLNAYILRNYLAHRDELDGSLEVDRDTGLAIQGVLVVFLEVVRRRTISTSPATS